MGNGVIKNEQAQKRLEQWFQTFRNRIPRETNSQEVSTSYGTNHILTAGDPNNPTLVCLHSMLTSSAHMLSEMGSLLDHYYIVAPDLPGQSVRGIPKRLSYKDDSHATWLKEVLDALDIQQASLFGISLGGFVARQFAALYPGRVNRLVLMVPAGIVQGPVFKGLMKMAWPMMKYKIKPTEANLRKVVDPLITTWDEDWANYLGDSFNDFAVNSKIPPVASDEELQQLTMPCLLLAAEQDISFPGRTLIDRAQSVIPNLEAELIEGSKHCPPTTEEFRRWMADRVHYFLNQN